MAPLAASPASFQPSKAAISAGELSFRAVSSSIVSHLPRRAPGDVAPGRIGPAYVQRARTGWIRPAVIEFSPAVLGTGGRARYCSVTISGMHQDCSGGGLQAVLFDMDGVLVDSEPLWFEAERAVMARLAGAWTPDDQKALVGGSMAVTVDYLLARGRAKADPAAVERWLVEAMTTMLSERPLPVMPGAVQLVAEVAAAGVPYGLVTSSERVIMDAVLARLPVTFPVTVCAGDVANCKPDPEGYLLAAQKLAVEPGRCVVVEDSPNGVAAAEAAGCLAVAVPSVVAIPAAPGRVVAGSMTELSLARLRAEFARRRED
jgi:HAD superfamily hydrolase (TIGR01509 family)